MRLVIALAAFAAATGLAFTAAAQDLPFTLTPIGPGVYAAIDGPQHKAGSNAGFVVGDNGVLVIDTFFEPDAAKALLAEIRKITPKPILYVVNTHHHIDHVSGDAVFKAAGATVIAHRNVAGWIHSENLHLFGAAITPELKARIEALPLPDRGIDKPLTLMLGKRRIEIRPVPGHTGGDLVVEIPDAKVLFAGDILWNHTGPTTIDGTIRAWTATLADFERLPASTFVPGHGELAGKPQVEDLRAFFADLARLTAQARQAGLSADGLVAATAPKFAALYPRWPRIDRSAPILVAQMEAELAGTKRVPVPSP